jgi:hypothetical protein
VDSWASMFGGPLLPMELAAVSVHFPVREIRSYALASHLSHVFQLRSRRNIGADDSGVATNQRQFFDHSTIVTERAAHSRSPEYVADCVQMWDSGTNMTKHEWVRTCKRVQSRLNSLKLDGLIPETNRTER